MAEPDGTPEVQMSFEPEERANVREEEVTEEAHGEEEISNGMASINISQEATDEADDAAQPTPTIVEPGEPTPTVTDMSSPQRSPFAMDGHSRTPDPSRNRADSQSTVATMNTTRSTKSSLVFVVKSLESIAEAKEARKNKKLQESLQRALTAIKGDADPENMPPEILFEPLQLASELQTVAVVTTALDCIGKLISYSYFSMPAEPQTEGGDAVPLIDRAIDTICDCFQSEATPVETQVQIVKSLLAAILNDKIVVHGAGLLKAVRLTYNIFLLSKNTQNQILAQNALTQMLDTVFERVKTRLAAKEARINASNTSLDREEDEIVETPIDLESTVDGSTINGSHDDDDDQSESASTAPSDMPVEKRDAPKMTLQSFETGKTFDDAKIVDAAPTLVTQVKNRPRPRRTISGDSPHEAEDEEDEIFVKDAYLVFRAMCRLSTKALAVEHVLDVKSAGMRSKLLSLYIIHSLINNHTTVFTSPYSTIRGSNDIPTPFVQGIKQYLCFSLSRNGPSSSKPVFEVSLEIFWLMVKFLRVMLKKEIEVFLKEIYFAILEKRAAPAWQKQMILGMLTKLAEDARALVEVYLNYDCDRTALDNMFEKMMQYLSSISTQPVKVTGIQQHAYQDHQARSLDSPSTSWQSRIVLRNLSTAALKEDPEVEKEYPAEYAMKYEALQAMVEVLRSLVNWSQQGVSDMAAQLGDVDPRRSADESRDSFDRRDVSISSASVASPQIGSDSPSGLATPFAEDDPMQLDREKQEKTAMAQAISTFNFKPKRGLPLLLKHGFIKSNNPRDIAGFLLDRETINKTTLGEFLGEGEQHNIDIMHAFVDLMEFRQTRFVDALRRFLQSFRLPGEAQKIDRFMLKFAERYIAGNPKAFANADTAYVLAYSVIMLNTDQHSAKIKQKRMTPEDFIKNNRGINDNADLPEEYLRGIYDEIRTNEIVLDTERETAANLGMLPQPSAGIASTIGQAVANASRDLRKEEYAQTEQFANRTEQLYKSLLRAQRRGGAAKNEEVRFIPASSFKHVGPMFQVTWMAFLPALAGAAQETENFELVKLCMEGMKLAVRISCLFDLSDPRQAFVQKLANLTKLYNISEMKAKELEALKALLEVAQLEGNLLKESWRDVLTCISQLDRFQLISTGVDEGAVPDVLRQTPKPGRTAAGKRNLNVPRPHRPRSQSNSVNYRADIAEESRSADFVRSVDRIFTNTEHMSGDGILHFVKALTQVSWQEIQSSGQSESPRTYSLQKIIEVSSYNLKRVRFEWANIWQVLGQHFSQVGCHTNTNVVFFALDSLRQLSMKFLEIEELPGFKFQKDFLKPFEHIIANSQVVPVKDMALRCLIQMIQSKGSMIKSGWRTMFGVFTVAAREPYEGIVNLAYDNVTKIYNDYFGIVISQGAFADLIVCLTQFSKNQKFQRKSLQAIEMLKATVPKMLKTPECPLSMRTSKGKERADGPVNLSQQTQEEQFWFPVLFAFHDVLMTGDDLEVRSRALNYLFETLMRYGGDFPLDFWDTLWRQLLYPIFMVLRSKSEMSKFATNEELSIWLSSTMIEALRKMIALFTYFFESLEYMLDRFLDLLTLCICQENETLARIGSNSLQQLIHENVKKFDPEHWSKIVKAFEDLFARTEATALFSAATSGSYHQKTPTNGSIEAPKSPSSESASFSDLPLSTPPPEPENGRADNALGINGLPSHSAVANISTDPDSPTTPRAMQHQQLENFREDQQPETPVVVTAARRKFFNQIITKCVLTLLMIETVNELFSNDNVYDRIPSTELLKLMALLKKSYHFAKKFNNDRDLRTRLFKEGFMKQPPNLLKQESGAASVYVAILFRMFLDTTPARVASREATENALVPLCADIISSYTELDEITQQRNIVTWRPVVVDVLEGYAGFPEEEFEKHIGTFAPLAVGLMSREMGPELQRAVQSVMARMFEVKLGVEIPIQGWGAAGSVRGMVTPSSERGNSVFGGSRRGSRNK